MNHWLDRFLGIVTPRFRVRPCLSSNSQLCRLSRTDQSKATNSTLGTVQRCNKKFHPELSLLGSWPTTICSVPRKRCTHIAHASAGAPRSALIERKVITKFTRSPHPTFLPSAGLKAIECCVLRWQWAVFRWLQSYYQHAAAFCQTAEGTNNIWSSPKRFLLIGLFDLWTVPFAPQHPSWRSWSHSDWPLHPCPHAIGNEQGMRKPDILNNYMLSFLLGDGPSLGSGSHSPLHENPCVSLSARSSMSCNNSDKDKKNRRSVAEAFSISSIILCINRLSGYQIEAQ